MQIPPNSELARIALDRTNGQDFEKFALRFMAERIGANFVPQGGVSDGGADGIIYVNESKATAFAQASIEADPKAKIKKTLKRLGEVGREVSKLTYISNQVIQKIDIFQEELEDELDISLRVYDCEYIIHHISSSAGSVAAYYEFLHHNTAFLEGVACGNVLSASDHITDPHVYTYLSGQLNTNDTDGSYTDGIVDALIVYALEGTDPNEGILRSEEEIRTRILEALPQAQQLIGSRLRDRLEAISAKDGRRVRWHKQNDRWALPFDDRKVLEQASIEDEVLRINVRQELAVQFNDLDSGNGCEPNELAELTIATIQRSFEKDGLRFAQFLSGDDNDLPIPFVSDSLREILDEADLKNDMRSDATDSINRVLRTIFYSSTPTQRTYMQRISRAYIICFSLQMEPRVLKFFDDMLSRTWIYVGADVLVTALSERYVPREDRHTRNLLRVVQEAGARLILTEPVLQEIHGHLRSTDNEFRDYIEPLESHYEYEIASQVPKILVRAYLYTRIFDVANRPHSWEQYMNQFCNYADLHRPAAQRQLQIYLTQEFGLDFVSLTSIQEISDDERHRILKGALHGIKSNDFLADNDAYMYEVVTYQRENRPEEQLATEFGYQTWWLSSGEGAAVRAMAQIDQLSDRILMRPGFLSKFIQFAPSAARARAEMSDFLPSVLGIRLARRITEDDCHKLIEKVREVESLEHGRVASKLAEMADTLKNVRQQEYDREFDTNSDHLSVDAVYSTMRESNG